MTDAIYYKRPNGQEPVREWIDNKHTSIRVRIRAKIQRLEEDDLQSLIDRRVVVPLKPLKKMPKINGLYELRQMKPGWRIAFYHDFELDIYVLLHGFTKKRDIQIDDINKAFSLAQEYIKNKGN